MRETGSRVVVGGEVRRLDAQSALVDTLRTAHRQQWRLGVYAPRDRTERVGQAAARVLDVDAGGELVSERPGRYASLDEFDPDGRHTEDDPPR